MIKKIIFLSGPMRGVDRKEAIAWREEIAQKLKGNYVVKHAYRGREEKETFPDPKGAIIRDKNDIQEANIIVVNDTYDNASMIGTAMEVLFAYQLNKPVIVFGKAHERDYWLNYHSHIRVDTLEEACEIIKTLFKD
jgi:nucleoside 2-deoxyribosyltransferase